MNISVAADLPRLLSGRRRYPCGRAAVMTRLSTGLRSSSRVTGEPSPPTKQPLAVGFSFQGNLDSRSGRVKKHVPFRPLRSAKLFLWKEGSMPERNRQEENEVHLKDIPKDPPPNGESSDPNGPAVVEPPPRGDDEL